MKFTRRSAQWRRQLERKKRLVKLLGGQVAATYSTGELPMKHARRQLEEPVADRGQSSEAAHRRNAWAGYKARRTGGKAMSDPVAALMASALVDNSHAKAHRAISDPATTPLARLFFKCMVGELGLAAQRAAALAVMEESQRHPEQPLPPDYERELNRVYGERCAEDGDLTQRGNNGSN